MTTTTTTTRAEYPVGPVSPPRWQVIRDFTDPAWQDLVAEADAEAADDPDVQRIVQQLTSVRVIERVVSYTIGRVPRTATHRIYTNRPVHLDSTTTTDQEVN